MSYLLDEFDDERRWLRPPLRRRRRLLLALPLVATLIVVSLTLGGRADDPGPPRDPGPPPGPTADQRALQAGRRALQAWGRFAVTNQLGTLRDWFWPNGPQYQKLAQEAKLRRGTKALGPLAELRLGSRRTSGGGCGSPGSVLGEDP